MSTNLGTILVGLGYDLSALEKGAPEAFRLINQQTLGMSAEMKRTSREGAESFRLIDEALGIHISRPITKLLTQEFPGLAKGLASVLGVGLTGALATIAFETFEHVARSIEHAQQAQEEFAKATEKSRTVFEDAMGSYEKAEKLRSLSGLGLELFKIDSGSIDEARKKIDELAASFAELDKKAEEASGWWNKLKAFTGDEIHKLYNSPTELAAERISKQFDGIHSTFDKMSKEDALHGTAESARYLSSQLDAAQKQLDAMSAHKMTGFETFLRNQAPFTQKGESGYSAAELEQQQNLVDRLKQLNDLRAAGAKDQGEQDAQASRKAALEAEKSAHAEMVADFQQDAADINEAANLKWKVAGQQDAITERMLSASASRFAEVQKVYGSMTQVAPPAVSPQRSDLVELEKITNDQTEAWKKAQQVIDQIETPMQKYNTQLQVLKTLQQEGRLTTQQLALAQQQLGEEFSRAQLRVMAMEQELEKLLRNSTSAKDGMHAFLLQLNLDASRNGTFVFDILNKGLQGFEDETAKALTGAQTNWRSFFESLDQMALKFFLNKMISQLLNGGGSGGGGGSGFGGILSSLGSLFGIGGGGGGGGDWSQVSQVLSDSGIDSFASGTDSAPGGMAWVGENGPELMNVPAGASITPNSALRGGGHTMVVHIDAKGAELGVETKIARALQAAGPSIVAQAVAHVNEIQRRTPH